MTEEKYSGDHSGTKEKLLKYKENNPLCPLNIIKYLFH